MTSGKGLLWAAAAVVVLAVALAVALAYAGGADAERWSTVVLIGGLALAAVLGVTGVLSSRNRRHSLGEEEDVLP